MFQKKQEKEPEFEYFSIYDSKVGHYRTPVLAINRLDVIRQIETLFKKEPGDQLCTNAEDFSVFKVGEYDKKTGVITSTPHEHIVNLHDVRSLVQRTAQEQNNPLRALNAT